jgi:sec-independent protein translocase protein TatB
MLDISFPELLLCFIVALVVLGPERMPAVVRGIGRWTGKARVYMRNLTAELERETQVAELKKQLDDAQRILREQSATVQQETHKLAQEVRPEVRPAVTAEPEAPKPPAEHA